MPNPMNTASYPNKPSPVARKTPQQMRDEAQDAQIAALMKNQERLDKKIHASMTVSALKSTVNVRTLSWQTAAKYIGSAYVTAYEKHKETVGKQNTQDALEMQIAFSILTVATAGSLAWVGLADKLQSFSQFLSDTVEDTAQAGVGEVFSAVAPMVTPMWYNGYAPQDPAGMTPLLYQNMIEGKIASAICNIEMDFKTIIENLRDVKMENWDYFDAGEQRRLHDEWEKKANEFAGTEDLPIGPDGKTPDVQSMADELERGMWAKYTLSQRYYRDFGIFKTDAKYDFVGWTIYDRLVELGIARKVYVHSNENAEALTSLLVKWAKGFKPKPFSEMRRIQEHKKHVIKKYFPPMTRYSGKQCPK